MKITAIKTYLMHAAPPETGGWPRVVETAMHDMTLLDFRGFLRK